MPPTHPEQCKDDFRSNKRGVLMTALCSAAQNYLGNKYPELNDPDTTDEERKAILAPLVASEKAGGRGGGRGAFAGGGGECRGKQGVEGAGQGQKEGCVVQPVVEAQPQWL
jgi:hypothetical protein